MPIIQRMVKVHQVLNKTTVGHTGLAAELNDQITLFCAYPAACELPAAPD